MARLFVITLERGGVFYGAGGKSLEGGDKSQAGRIYGVIRTV